MTYYSVKLNVPHGKADAIRSLVPEGAAVSGTLIDILLDVAKQRGIETGGVDGAEVLAPSTVDPAWQRRMERRVKRIEDRLDAALAVAARGPRGGAR